MLPLSKPTLFTQIIVFSFQHVIFHDNELFYLTCDDISDAQCVSLPDDKEEGLMILRPDKDTVLVPFRQNVTLQCNSNGRNLRGTATSGFRQCVYDPKPVRCISNYIMHISYQPS